MCHYCPETPGTPSLPLAQGTNIPGASQGAQLEVDTFDTPFDAIQQC